MLTAIGLILIIVPALFWFASVIGVIVWGISMIGSNEHVASINLVGWQGVLALISISAGIVVLSYGYGLI